jgi:hypothetical protein
MNTDKMNVFYLLTSAAALAKPATGPATSSNNNNDTSNITPVPSVLPSSMVINEPTKETSPISNPEPSSNHHHHHSSVSPAPTAGAAGNGNANGNLSLLPVSSLMALSNVVSQQPSMLNKETISSGDSTTNVASSTSPSPAIPPPSASPSPLTVPIPSTTSPTAKPFQSSSLVDNNANVVAWFKDENYPKKRNYWKPPKSSSSMVYPNMSNASLTELSFVSTSPQAANLGSTGTHRSDSSLSNNNAGDPIHDPTQAVLPVVMNPKSSSLKDKKKKRKLAVDEDTDSDSDYGDDLSSSDSGYSPRDVPPGDSRTPLDGDPRLRDAMRQIDKLKGKLQKMKIKYKTLQEQQQQNKGKREIRNANACESHKKRHQKCPDNCPGRLQIMAQQQNGYGDMAVSPSTLGAPPKKRGKSLSPVMPGMGGKGQLLQA